MPRIPEYARKKPWDSVSCVVSNLVRFASINAHRTNGDP